MPRFTLVVRPDGRAFLTANERLPETEKAVLVSAVREWQDAPGLPLAIIDDDCDVVQVVDVALDLPAVPA